MVKTDIHDDCALRRFDDVRRVKSPAETGLKYNNVTFFLHEPEHGRGGDQLKFSRMLVHLFGLVPDGGDAAGKRVGRNLLTVYLHTLGKTVEIGRRV